MMTMNVEQMRKNVSMMILPLSFECSATIYKEKLSRLRNRCVNGDRKHLLIPANHRCQCNGKSIQEPVDNTLVSKTKHSKEKINVRSGDLRYKIYKKEPFSLAWVLSF